MNQEVVTTFLSTAASKAVYIAVIVAACAILIRLSRQLVRKYFQVRTKLASYLPNSVSEQKARTMEPLLNNIIKYLVCFIAGVSILSKLGVNVASILTVAGVGAIALALGAQSLMSDFIGGFFILSENQYAVGDYVTIQGHTGKVEAIGLRTTQLRAVDGTVFIITNGSVGIVTNMSNEFICAETTVGVAYDSDIPRVLEILNDEMQQFFHVATGLRKVPLVLGVDSLGESSVNIRVRAECAPGEQLHIQRDLNLAIQQRLEREGIQIPFPQRTVHMAKEE